MKSSDELSELVHSMSPSEKRYFKLQAATFKDDSHYLLLFDLIDKREELSDTDLRQSLQQLGVTVSLSRLKNYLHQLIMKTLREYHLEHYPEFKIIEAYRDFKILKDRKLERQASKSLSKAVKLSKEYERYAYLWELNRHLASDDLLEADATRFKRNLDAVFEIQKEAREKMAMIDQCHQLDAEAIIMQKEHIKTNDPEKLETIERLLAEAKALEGKGVPSYGMAHLYGLYDICYAQTNRYEEALAANSLYVKLLKEKGVNFGSSDEHIWFALTNQLYHLLYQGRVEEFKKLTADIIADPGSFFLGKSDYYKSALLFATYNFEVSFAILSGNFDDAEQYMEPAQKILDRHPDIAIGEFLFSWLYRSVVLNFGLGIYDKALQAINAILDGKVLKYGPDFGSYIKMLNIIIHYELGHTKVLPSAMKATEQFARGKSSYNVIDKLLIEMLKKLIKCKGQEEEREVCRLYADKIKAEVESDESVRTPLMYFDFLTWMNGKASGMLFGQAMKQKAMLKKG